MSNYNQEILTDLENPNSNELPSLLNVLTILTFIGSGLAILTTIYNYFTVCESLEKMMSQDIPEMSGTIGKLMDSAMELLNKQCDNRLVITISTIATSVMCIFGALLMRKRKIQGFIVYIIGELIGPMSMMTILGASSMKGFWMILGLFLPIIFVILYATQRKYLVK